MTCSHIETLGGMGGERPQGAAEPILRPLASACMYLKGRPTRRITEKIFPCEINLLVLGWMEFFFNS